MKNKKVLYFIPEFPRLTETFIAREVNALLNRKNVDVVVLSLEQASGKSSKEVLGVTHYRKLTWADALVAVKFFLFRTTETSTAFTYAMEDKSKNLLARIYLFLKAVGYTKIIEEFKPEHLHAHFFSDPSTIVLIAATILKIPYSISGHAKDVLVEGTLIKEKVVNSKFVTLCNKFAYNKCLEAAGLENAGKVRLTYHGIDPQEILNAPKDSSESLLPTIFTVARLVEKKGLAYLVEASKLLKQQDIEHRVIIAGGPGDIYQSLLELVKSNDLEDTVFIEGGGTGVDHERVLSLYKSADVFVLPSIEINNGDVDGVPNVIVEAALSKVPIITTDAGGITDFIEDNETGVIVPQKDAQALAVQIVKVLSDEDLVSDLTSKAYERALKMFNLDQNVAELESLLLV
jgi:glycosyltransferase involved in cell wall biosynthesis